jgi:hypothetical protein
MIDKCYALSGAFAVYTTLHRRLFMEAAADSDTYLEMICYPVEKYLIGYAIRDKERLISATHDALNEPDRI